MEGFAGYPEWPLESGHAPCGPHWIADVLRPPPSQPNRESYLCPARADPAPSETGLGDRGQVKMQDTLRFVLSSMWDVF